VQIAVPKPPYRLRNLQLNCAVPARIDGTAVLVWRHPVLGQPTFELHVAVKDLDLISDRIHAK
jgi:glycine cleavage system aminomethyltransferase T